MSFWSNYPKKLLFKLRFLWFLKFYVILFVIFLTLIISVFFILPGFSGSPLMFIVAVVISVGIAYMVYYLRGKQIEFKEREKLLKKGIKAEEDVLNVLKNLDSSRFVIYSNVEFKIGNGRPFDIDFIVVDKKTSTGYFIDVKSYSGYIYVDPEGYVYINGKKRDFKPAMTLLKFKGLFKENRDYFVNKYGIKRYMLAVVFPYSNSVSSDYTKVSFLTLSGLLRFIIK